MLGEHITVLVLVGIAVIMVGVAFTRNRACAHKYRATESAMDGPADPVRVLGG